MTNFDEAKMRKKPYFMQFFGTFKFIRTCLEIYRLTTFNPLYFEGQKRACSTLDQDEQARSSYYRNAVFYLIITEKTRDIQHLLR
jgi:hypothetical protein